MLKYLFRIPGFFLAFIISVLFFELYFQTSEISVPSIIQNDSNLGRSFRPEARINLVKESFYIGKVNALGYLGPAYPALKNTQYNKSSSNWRFIHRRAAGKRKISFPKHIRNEIKK